MFGLVISDKVKSILFKILLVVFCALLVWANYAMLQAKDARIDALGVTVTTLKSENKVLDDRNKEVLAALSKKADSDDATEEVKLVVKKVEEQQEKIRTDANKYVDTQLQKINAKYAALEKTKINEERRSIEISLERARGLWKSYCIQEPAADACKE